MLYLNCIIPCLYWGLPLCLCLDKLNRKPQYIFYAVWRHAPFSGSFLRFYVSLWRAVCLPSMAIDNEDGRSSWPGSNPHSQSHLRLKLDARSGVGQVIKLSLMKIINFRRGARNYVEWMAMPLTMASLKPGHGSRPHGPHGPMAPGV